MDCPSVIHGAKDWFMLAVGFAFFGLGAFVAAPRIWRGDTVAMGRIRKAVGTWWMFGDALLDGAIRSGPAIYVTLLLAFGGFGLNGLAHMGSERTAFATLRVLACSLSDLLLILSGFFAIVSLGTILLNWPKWAVPPAMRKDRGAIAQWFRQSKKPGEA